MRAYLTRRYLFSASHRLHCDAMTAAENQAVYGKCNNPHGHGHNYSVEVTVAGRVDPRTGMVCNLVDLDSFVHEKILERLTAPQPAAAPVNTPKPEPAQKVDEKKLEALGKTPRPLFRWP